MHSNNQVRMRRKFYAASYAFTHHGTLCKQEFGHTPKLLQSSFAGIGVPLLEKLRAKLPLSSVPQVFLELGFLGIYTNHSRGKISPPGKKDSG